ncbi:hypothetical protein ASE86_08225 [Sphingomonas sp. Leaf33]|uniref:hypothetical protein n=1 Tax=Sphingomonas sp. Leaf33 TaxID=1736215 RepID=UPI0006FF5885|nr:hypothetical protein [Sphingomonas sp. Leaf33]KQN26131.1 hypothetical protein ASE86_08225 [Sphingomonas sp. Leaf33]
MSDLRSDREPDTQPDAIAPPKTDAPATPTEAGEDDVRGPESESPDAGIGEAGNRAGSSDL